MTFGRMTQDCPNCRREFYGNVPGAYCPECWVGWCRNDGTYESRTKTMADLLAEQAARPVLRPPSKAKGEKK